MTTLIIDTQNMLHRARSGFTSGEHSVAYNFFRGFRAQVEQFKPDRVVFALEGRSQWRYDLLPEYKATRKTEPGTSKHEGLHDFYRQVDEVIPLLGSRFPVSLVRHPEHEADDTVANIIYASSSAIDFIVVSTDTDFTQLLNTHDNVRIYNPVKKSFVEWDKEVDYVAYKALKGDGSDNIPGVPGFGEKKAMNLARDFAFLPPRPEMPTVFERNQTLVRFARWTEDDKLKMTSTQPERDWDAVKAQFDAWEFASITNEKSWPKFTASFDRLWV